MKTPSGARRAATALWLALGIGVFPPLAMAHAVVYPRASTSTTVIGATEANSAVTGAAASGAPLYLAIAALVLALISLGIALRPAGREQGRPA